MQLRSSFRGVSDEKIGHSSTMGSAMMSCHGFSWSILEPFVEVRESKLSHYGVKVFHRQVKLGGRKSLPVAPSRAISPTCAIGAPFLSFLSSTSPIRSVKERFLPLPREGRNKETAGLTPW